MDDGIASNVCAFYAGICKCADRGRGAKDGMQNAGCADSMARLMGIW